MQFIISYLQKLVLLIIPFKASLARIERKLDRLDVVASQILALLVRDEEIAVVITFDFEVEGKISQGVFSMTITDSQQITAKIAPKNKRGQPAPVQPGSVIWTGPSFVAITPSADGMSAVIVAMGVGSDQLSVSADADLGEGVVTISGTVPFEVIASQATSLGIEFGTPEEQQEPGPTPNA